jgi:hypothetical protein
MLVDCHGFLYNASVPWPKNDDPQMDWAWGVYSLEEWLRQHVGPRYKHWAYDDCNVMFNIGVAFRWERDRTLFVLTWTR